MSLHLRICVFVDADLFSSRIFCVFFSSRIEIHCFISVFVSLFVCISDVFSSRIFRKYVACVFFSSRIEIHCFIKGKLPEKSRCKILSARFPKTLFSWYFLFLYLFVSFKKLSTNINTGCSEPWNMFF